MNKSTIDDLTTTLLNKKYALSSNLTTRAPKLNETGKESSEFEEFVQTERIKSIDESLTQRERLLLRDIDAALERISEGTYGICSSCEEDINPARLAALPTATLCIECAAAIESSRPRAVPRTVNTVPFQNG